MNMRLSDAIRSLKASNFDSNGTAALEAPVSPSFEIVASTQVQIAPEIAQSTSKIVKLRDIVVADRLRQYLDAEKTESLAKSIQQYGFRGVLWVRMVEGYYHLVAGGRRYAACQMVGISEVAVEVLDVTDAEALQLELLENFQREDLNPIEEAEGVMRLLEVTLELERSEVISLLNRMARQERNRAADNIVRSEKNAANRNGASPQPAAEENLYQQIEEVFNLIGRYTPESFRTHRLPLLNLPQPVIQAVRTGQLEYTKARLIARVKDEDNQKKLLIEAIQAELSHAELTQRVKEAQTRRGAVSPVKNNQQLQARANTIMRRIKSAKLEGPTRKKVEKLMAQLEELLAQNS